MRLFRKLLVFMGVTGTILLSLSSCDIYADQRPGSDFTNVNATDYTKWVYLSLTSQKDSVTLNYDDAANIPANWDIAIHRYDIKTNDGAAVEVNYTSLESFKSAIASGLYQLPEPDQFVRDTDGKITIDMSHMMEGYLVYADTKLNKELGKWLNVDTGQMPPIYTPSNKVYLLQLKDGTYAALRFTAYRNEAGISGYISFDYIYPLNFEE